MTEANQTGSNGNASKGRAQDVLGLVLCAVGGFGAVSVLMQVLGNNEGVGALLGLFLGVQGLLGTFPTFVAMSGMAVLGCLLFLRAEPLDAGRQLLGLLGLALGVALTLGGISAGAGGTIGGALADAMQGSLAWLGALLSIVLGLAVLGTSAYLTWSERLHPFVAPAVERVQVLAKGLRERAQRPDTAAPRKAAGAPEDPHGDAGVSADEAAALVPEAPRAPARRKDPFHAPVTAPEPSPPAQAEEPEVVLQSQPPAGSNIEDIAKVLSRASSSSSRAVPESLRGPDPEDDVRLRGGVPEGAKPLDLGMGAPPAPRAEPPAAPSPLSAGTPVSPLAGGPPAAPTSGGAPEESASAETDAPAPAEATPAPDELLAELRAANERLKVIDEAASKEAAAPVEEPAAPPRRGYWSRGEQASAGAAEATPPAAPAAGPTASWEIDTPRPSWETPVAEEPGTAATAGPRMSWEGEQPERPVASEADTSVVDEPEELEEEPQELAEAEDGEEWEEDGEWEEVDEDDEEYDEDDEDDPHAEAEDEEYDEEEEGEDEEEPEEEGAYAEAEDEEYDEEEEGEDEEEPEEEGAYAEDEEWEEDDEEWDEEEPEEEAAVEATAEASGDGEQPDEAELDEAAGEEESVEEREPEAAEAAEEPAQAKASKPSRGGRRKAAAKQEDGQAQLFAAEKDAPEASPGRGKQAAEAAPDEEPDVVLQPQSAPAAASAAGEAPAEGFVVAPSVYQAGRMFLEENRVAVSMLQRRFEMDFDQACGILDELQEIGLIGPYLGGKTRDILLSQEEWEAVARGASPAGRSEEG